jgi:carboxypeptidase Q
VRARLQTILGLLEPLGATLLTAPGGGVDILPLEERGVPVAGLKVAGERYFWYHHSAADTVDKVDPQDLGQVAAALAVVVLGVADLL